MVKNWSDNGQSMTECYCELCSEMKCIIVMHGLCSVGDYRADITIIIMIGGEGKGGTSAGE